VFQSFCNRKVQMPQTEIVIKNAIGETGKYSNSKDIYLNSDVHTSRRLNAPVLACNR
jgi:hypothetical protein